MWLLKSVNRQFIRWPYKEVESCDKRRRMDLTQRNALLAFFLESNALIIRYLETYNSVHIHFEKLRTENAIAHPEEEFFYFKIFQNIDQKKIYIFGKRKEYWKIEKISIGERERRLKNNRRGGFAFVWEKNLLLGKIGRLFHREADFLLGTTDVEIGERLAIVRPEREVEEEGSGRGNLGRNKAVITLVPQLTGQLIKSRGLLIPLSLFFYYIGAYSGSRQLF